MDLDPRIFFVTMPAPWAQLPRASAHQPGLSRAQTQRDWSDFLP